MTSNIPDQSLVKPIVDPDGDYVWLPVAAHPTREAAEAAAREYSPARPCYLVGEPVHMRIRPLDEDDEDDADLMHEYGAETVGEPCGDDEGQAYWPVQLYPEPGGGA